MWFTIHLTYLLWKRLKIISKNNFTNHLANYSLRTFCALFGFEIYYLLSLGTNGKNALSSLQEFAQFQFSEFYKPTKISTPTNDAYILNNDELDIKTAIRYSAINRSAQKFFFQCLFLYFGSNATDERLLLERYIQHIKIRHIFFNIGNLYFQNNNELNILINCNKKLCNIF